ncbi:helix-turn-helix domain-containing protein [Desulfitobacterium metallireducens]|uniref:DNA-binding protein n=1 Tax=Desulfitobacterium metallireducens DSM 15288 TaxID=871968 RepID=W0EBI9_9FIRM|nr:helix-turn-helix domain-containing protein [Desulfitobacterium metallireducens]AHF06574.1 DNA-binding protein [Desulfitobacterium metallireducens DSM 15288]
MSLSRELNENAPYFEIGRYINQCRVKRGVSLQHLSVRLGVNPSYLREVERGERVPSDEFIRSLTENCDLDENYIFSCLGKSPLIAREELDHHAILQETLKEIGMSELSEQQKEELYQKFSAIAESALIKNI